MPTIPTPQALRFPPAVTEEAVETITATLPDNYIIAQLLQLSSYLIGIVENTNFFGPVGHDPYSPTLRTLHDRLHLGCINPSILECVANDSERNSEILGQRVHVDIADRPLEDFEDIYYAVLARMRSMLQTINERLHSGFSTVDDLLFGGGPSIEVFSNGLLAFWVVLNEPEFAGTLDAAVRLSRVTATYHEINRMVEMNRITVADAVPFLDELYAAKHEAFGLRYELLEHSPALTGVYLLGRHGVLLDLEAKEYGRKLREAGQLFSPYAGRRKKKEKRSNTRVMLAGMQKGLRNLRDEDGASSSSAVLRPSPGKQVRFVEAKARVISQEVSHHDGATLEQPEQVVDEGASSGNGGHQPLNTAPQNLRHFGSDDSLNFRLKKLRVSEHWKDLRDSVGDGYGADTMEL